MGSVGWRVGFWVVGDCGPLMVVMGCFVKVFLFWASFDYQYQFT